MENEIKIGDKGYILINNIIQEFKCVQIIETNTKDLDYAYTDSSYQKTHWKSNSFIYKTPEECALSLLNNYYCEERYVLKLKLKPGEGEVGGIAGIGRHREKIAEDIKEKYSKIEIDPEIKLKQKRNELEFKLNRNAEKKLAPILLDGRLPALILCFNKEIVEAMSLEECEGLIKELDRTFKPGNCHVQ